VPPELIAILIQGCHYFILKEETEFEPAFTANNKVWSHLLQR